MHMVDALGQHFMNMNTHIRNVYTEELVFALDFVYA